MHKKVMVSPARTGWTIKHDKWGKPIHCQVEYPATYKTVAHKKLVRKARTSYSKIPAQYRYVEEQVLWRKAKRKRSFTPLSTSR